MLPLLILLAALGVSGTQLYAHTIIWDMSSPLQEPCPSCKISGGRRFDNYQCSPSNASLPWPQGTLHFEDPLPVGAQVHEVLVEYFGRFNCAEGAQGNGGHYYVLLDNEIVEISQFPTFTDQPCGCPNCAFPLRLEALSGGADWSSYRHQGNNSLEMRLAHFAPEPQRVCLSRVNLTLVYHVPPQDPPLPEVYTFSPHNGPQQGRTPVLVEGSGFDAKKRYFCTFGTQRALAEWQSARELLCRSPALVVGQRAEQPFQVREESDTISNLTAPFIYYQQPTVTDLQPSEGNATGGTPVLVLGEGFFSDSLLACRFGEGNVPVVGTWVPSKRAIQCISPRWNGSVEVTVEIAENGADFTSSGVLFRYSGVTPPRKGGLDVWELALIAGGGALGVLMLVLLVCACCWRSRTAAKRKRVKAALMYLSDPEGGDADERSALLSSDAMRRAMRRVERVSMKDVQIVRKVGRGSFGEVFRARWNGTDIAIKKLPSHLVRNAKFLEDFAEEINLMSNLRHPNVLQFLAVGQQDGNVFMLLEYMSRGSLYQVLHDPAQDLDERMLVSILLDAARGMTYLHSRRIVHRDLKSHNLLLSESFTCKICDFGLSRLLDGGDSRTLTACGTPSWTAPEVLRSERYTQLADVYSFAIVMWECMTREDPFAGLPPFQVVFTVGSQGSRPDVPTRPLLPDAMITLMCSCWAEEPQERPPFEDITQELEMQLEMYQPPVGSSFEAASSTSIN